MPRPAWSLAVALLALPALALAACGDDDDADSVATFEQEGLPFTFSYPGNFELTDDVELSQQLGAGADETVAIALDEQDGIIIETFTLDIAVNEENLALAKREIDGLLQQVGPDVPETAETEIAGLPALTASGVPIAAADGAESDLHFIFDGDQEYLFNCQSTPDNRAEVGAACDQALETLSLE